MEREKYFETFRSLGLPQAVFIIACNCTVRIACNVMIPYTAKSYRVPIYGHTENLNFSAPERFFDLIFAIPPLFWTRNTIKRFISTYNL